MRYRETVCTSLSTGYHGATLLSVVLQHTPSLGNNNNGKLLALDITRRVRSVRPDSCGSGAVIMVSDCRCRWC